MANSFRLFLLAFSFICLGGLAACGSDSDSTSADAGSAAASDDEDDGADHEGEDHDEDEDHEGDDHDGDEDHDDEGHDDDEDHDDHDDESSTGLGAHEHGSAELTVAWSDGDMVIDLISPAFNIFGFEREPETDDEKAIAADRTEALTAPGMITINSEAGCSLVDEVVTDFEVEGSHAELTATWEFACDSPDQIKQLDAAALFAEFPNLEDVDAQRASASGQSAAELSPSATTFDLE